MPGQFIKLSPSISPQDYFNINKEELGIVPDGTGLQILFKIKDEYYLIAGPRSGSVLSVNGGAIEKKDHSFAEQLAEELSEETFGEMSLSCEKGNYALLLKDGSSHTLSMLDSHAFLMHKTGKYAYITFTAVCNTVTLEQLNYLAKTLTPTANFWNTIGNFLFPHTRTAPRDDTFAVYWESNREARDAFIAQLVTDYNQLKDSNVALLVDPKDILQAQNIDESLNALHQIKDHAALMTLFRHTVGRFSERSGYHVFHAHELVRAATANGKEKAARDIHDQVVATGGIFNDEAVAKIIPALSFTKEEPHLALTQLGLFATAAAVSQQALTRDETKTVTP